MKHRVIMGIAGMLFLGGCATQSAQHGGEFADVKKQLYELQKTVGAQSARIEELNNKILLLKDRVDGVSSGEIPPPPMPPELQQHHPKAPMPLKPVVAEPKEIIPPVKAADDEPQQPAKNYTGPERVYNQAVADAKKPQLTPLEKDVEAMVKNYRESPLTNNALFLYAETLYNHGQYQKSAGQFERLYKLFPDGNKAVAALYRLALCYKKLGRVNEANEAFQNIISVYPGSREALDAQKQLEKGGDTQK